MLSLRHEFEVALKVLTPLRVSTGDDALQPDRTDQKARLVSIVGRDYVGNLVIPAASLKGVLRASLGENNESLLFGDLSQHAEGFGGIGRLWLEDAMALGTTKASSFIKTGIGLDPDLATAEANKLFNREFVTKDTLFTVKFTWFGEVFNEGALDADLGQVLAALNCGLHVGGSRSKGAGKLQADLGILKVTRQSLNSDGYLKPAILNNQQTAAIIKAIQTLRPPSTGRSVLTLELACDGLFMSRDGIADVHINGATREVGVALVEGGRCALWPESLAGALRARATWLANVHALDLVEPVATIDGLFGSKDCRSKVWVESIICTKGETSKELTSISIDRVTGGGRDGKVYTLRPYVAPTFVAEISFPSDLGTDEAKVIQWLRDDFVSHGLELGHGGAKGFGWFDVTVIQERVA